MLYVSMSYQYLYQCSIATTIFHELSIHSIDLGYKTVWQNCFQVSNMYHERKKDTESYYRDTQKLQLPIHLPTTHGYWFTVILLAIVVTGVYIYQINRMIYSIFDNERLSII